MTDSNAEPVKCSHDVVHKEVLGTTLCVCCRHCQEENERLNKELKAAREREERLRKALEKIWGMNPLCFNGERVTSIYSEALGMWQIVAKEALQDQGRNDQNKPIRQTL